MFGKKSQYLFISKSKKEGKDQESIQSSTTLGPRYQWGSDNFTIRLNKPHLTQDTNRKMTSSQLDITSESQEVSPFPAGDHKDSINRRARKHNKNKTEIT